MSGTVEHQANYGPYRLEITGSLVQETGFRIGAGDSLNLVTDLPVLRWETGPSGRPYIPGSSLRGVMRAHLEREQSLLGFTYPDALLSLFGNAPKGEHDETKSCRGRLRVMDCLPETVPASSTEIRDHVSIDADTGAAKDKAKFDAEHVVKGQVNSFPFHLIYEGESENDQELILLREALRALEAGELAIGSRSSIGFGRFTLPSVKYIVFDRSTAEGLRSFLACRLHLRPEDYPSPTDFALVNPVKAPSRVNPPLLPLHRLTFTLSIPCNGPLLVKAAALPKDLVADGIPDASFLTTKVGGHPLIPGAGIRGVLRHRAEKICTSQMLGDGPVLRLFGDKKEKGAQTARRGLVQFEDCILSSDEAVKSDHVAVDRITHAAADTAKFEDRALNGPRLSVTIQAQFTDHPQDRTAIALLLFLIRDLLTPCSGIAFGSQTTRGYGSLDKATLTELQGSVHGDLADKLFNKTGAVGRLPLADLKLTSEKVFERLCSALNENWTPTKQGEPA